MKFPSFEPNSPFAEQVNATKLNQLSNNGRSNGVTQNVGARMTRTTGGTSVVVPKNRVPLQPPPFWPVLYTLGTEDAPKYMVGVSRGIVCERVTGPDGTDAQNTWEVHGITDESGNPKLYEIEEGESLYVVVKVKKEGIIGSDSGEAVELGIEVANKESTHYYPPGGDSTGSAGTYYYPLVTLESVTLNGYATLGLNRYYAGSNIDHFADLPQMENTGSGSVGRVFQKFDKDDNQYKFRVITAESPLAIEETTDEIKVKFDGGKNLNFEIYSTAIDFDAKTITRTLSETLCWRNGIYVGKFAYGTTLPAATGDLDWSSADTLGGGHGM